MDIHLPKVPHSWRELGKEIGIIVVGVLIALTAEQLVDAWQWHRKIAAAEAAMKHELLWDDGPQLYQRAALYPCMAARLDAIRAAVDANRSRAEIWKAIDAYWTAYLTYDTVAHDALDSSDVSSHMRQAELQPYSLAYAVMPATDRVAADEVRDYGRLRSFRRMGGPLSDAESMQVLGALEALRDDNAGMFAATKWTLPQLRAIGPLDQERVGGFMRTARAHYGDCVRDLPAAPPNG